MMSDPSKQPRFVLRYRWFMRGAGVIRTCLVLTGTFLLFVFLVFFALSLDHQGELYIDPPGDKNDVILGYDYGAAWVVIASDLWGSDEWKIEFYTEPVDELSSLIGLYPTALQYKNYHNVNQYIVPIPYLWMLLVLPLIYHLLHRFLFFNPDARPCLNCGYDLRCQSIDSSCPECGWRPASK